MPITRPASEAWRRLLEASERAPGAPRSRQQAHSVHGPADKLTLIGGLNLYSVQDLTSKPITTGRLDLCMVHGLADQLVTTGRLNLCTL